jgi:hypothetical protein
MARHSTSQAIRNSPNLRDIQDRSFNIFCRELDPYRFEIESLLASGSTQKFIVRRYHTTEANLHNWLKKHGLKLSKSRPGRVISVLLFVPFWKLTT